MPFRVKDVLIVNATIIIGLLILLTFQSISSSFIETESADFMREWHTVQNQYSTTVGLLEDWDCIEDKIFLEGLVIPTPYNFDHVSKEMEDEIKKNCSKWLIESLEHERYLMELDVWGYDFAYLQQVDEDGNVYNIGDASFNTELAAVESDYFRGIVTGPLWVNITNIVMVMPFVFSAAVASFNVLRARVQEQDEETNSAGRWSVGLMGFGFIILFFGLIVIISGFYEVYSPFIEQQAEYTWNTDGPVLSLDKGEMPFDETRDVP